MSSEATRQKILVIDDEANMGHMQAAVLKKAGYEVDTASDGQTGLLKAEQMPYDYILCDIKMPVMSGMDFLRAAGQRINQGTVIMMSAYGSIDTAIEAMKLGAYDYISTPFKPDEVLLTLKKAEERAETLEGYLIALANLDEFIRIIRSSSNREEAKIKLLGFDFSRVMVESFGVLIRSEARLVAGRYSFSEAQANAILELRLYQLTGLEREKVKAEYPRGDRDPPRLRRPRVPQHRGEEDPRRGGPRVPPHRGEQRPRRAPHREPQGAGRADRRLGRGHAPRHGRRPGGPRRRLQAGGGSAAWRALAAPGEGLGAGGQDLEPRRAAGAVASRARAGSWPT